MLNSCKVLSAVGGKSATGGHRCAMTFLLIIVNERPENTVFELPGIRKEHLAVWATLGLVQPDRVCKFVNHLTTSSVSHVSRTHPRALIRAWFVKCTLFTVWNGLHNLG